MGKFYLLASVFALIIGSVTLIFKGYFSELLYNFTLNNFSPDKNIRGGLQSFQTNIIFLIIFFYALSIGLYMLSIPKISNSLNVFLTNGELKEYFFQDQFTPGQFLKITFIAAAIGSIFTTLAFTLDNFNSLKFLFGEDNVFEWSAAILFLLASIMLFIGGIRIFSNKSSSFPDRLTYLAIITGISIVLFWIFGEEISWGQRLFNWRASGNFRTNFQQETNLHNFFNPIINSVYAIVVLSLAITVLIGWVRKRNSTSALFQLLFPHPSSFPAIVFLLYAGKAGEMSEIILALFIFLYSLRIYIASYHLKSVHIALM